MDKPTRNLIQRATQDARELLEFEYQEQLEGTFDILLSGTIAPEPGSHLDDTQRLVREKLVAAIEHKVAGGISSAEAVAAYLREAAFTTLNRFVALKMLEARGLVQECISKGEESSGFKEYSGLAPGLVSLPDHGYRMYIESIFDEIGCEVKVLFDRRDVASLLWPRRQALNDLLEILNQPELDGVWAEDETIGWVYQYFNSDDERRQMRAESSAPRNSRELAVRNQFFTPRYVVEFLTDNTLVRTWYEMRQGETRLKEECKYLVRRPKEIFLKEDQEPPQDNNDNQEDLSQEELLRKPVYIPFRAKKDPRDLKILDPACGSGHFLLYAFELLLTIYEEVWADPQSPKSEVTGSTIREDFPNLEELRAAVPGLILRHNLHGIEIDHRAAQIAALALWMRTQRAFNDYGISRSERPAITKTNIVVAEPMPGEKDLLEDFLSSLREDRLEKLIRKVLKVPEGKQVRATRSMAESLCGLVRTIWEKMELAGEAGSLLKIEEELATAIDDGRKEWEDKLPLFRVTEYDFEGNGHDRYYRVVPGQDTDFWHHAELLTIEALKEYTKITINGNSFRRKLFANDATQGLAFVNICRERFDVLLMNPPFGEPSISIRQILKHSFPLASHDLAPCFIDRATSLTKHYSMIGCISTRTIFFLNSSSDWRKTVPLKSAPLEVFIDFGMGVMDDAMVEAAAFTLRRYNPNRIALFVRAIEIKTKSDIISKLRIKDSSLIKEPIFGQYLNHFLDIPSAPFAYWCTPAVRKLFKELPKFEDVDVVLRVTNPTADNFRFLRNWWEVDPRKIGRTKGFVPYAKGGEAKPYYYDINLVAEWDNSVPTYKGYTGTSHRPDIRPASLDYFFCPGIMWPLRASKFTPQVFPEGTAFSARSQCLFAPRQALSFYLGLLGSSIVDYLFKLVLGRFGFPEFVVGGLRKLPCPQVKETSRRLLADAGCRAAMIARTFDMVNETTHLFVTPFHSQSLDVKLSDLYRKQKSVDITLKTDLQKIQAEIDLLALQIFGIDLDEINNDRITTGHNGSISQNKRQKNIERTAVSDFVINIFSWCVGIIFGRWDIRLIKSKLPTSQICDPFDPIPTCPPGMLLSDNGYLIKRTPVKYPINIAWDGILVDDQGHNNDIIKRIDKVFTIIWEKYLENNWYEIIKIYNIEGADLRVWFRKTFFKHHIRRYHKSGRKAPIYWELATLSNSYTVWLYYHRFTQDTFYKVLNDYVAPKLQHEERKLINLRQEHGSNPTANQRKEITEQETFVEELRIFKQEVGRIAPLWNPDLNDGVIINFALLWRLVPQHRAWQKECKDCWDKLVKGEYDWAHLAMHLWPERVVPKCAEDRSLAIAHELEDVFWYEDEDGKWKKREVSQKEIDELIQERTSPSVKAALNELFSAPVPVTTHKRNSRK